MPLSSDQPIAVCAANEVEAWDYPFYLRPPTDLEPLFLFLEEHLYNLTPQDGGILQGLVRINSVEDLQRLGFEPDEEGIFRL